LRCVDVTVVAHQPSSFLHSLSSLPVYSHPTSPFLLISLFTSQSRSSYRLVRLFLWIHSSARGF